MERQTLKAEIRENTGKGAARTLRREGSIPAVIYRGNKSTPLRLDAKELSKFIRDTSGDQVLVNLKLDSGEKIALLKDFQIDPVDGGLLHADFFEVSMKEKVRVYVHVTTTGEPIGVKRDKGIIQHGIREIEVECLPTDIPGHLQLDISGFEIGDSFHVSDVALPRGVTLLAETDEVIVTVTAPKIEEEVPVAEEAAAAAAEPEVVEKGKAKEEKEEEKEKKKEEA